MIRRLIGGDRRKEKAVTEMSPESSGQHRTIPFLKRWNAEKNIDRGSVSPTPCSSPARLPPRPQSLDLASFRVVKGNLNEICEKIGVQSIDDLGIPLASWLALKSPSSSKSEFGIRLGPYVLPAEGNNTIEHNRASSNTEETVPKERAGDERIEVIGLPAMTSRHLEREETPCHRVYFSACCSFSSSLDDDCLPYPRMENFDGRSSRGSGVVFLGVDRSGPCMKELAGEGVGVFFPSLPSMRI